MAGLELEPFADEHLDAAGQLLADRHAHHRAAEPLIPNDDARAAVEAAWRKEGANGVAALRRGNVVGYLFGLLEGERPIWGNLSWVDRASHAAGGVELVRDVYAAAAEVWVERGAIRHYVLVPALDRDLDPWYRLRQRFRRSVAPASGSRSPSTHCGGPGSPGIRPSSRTGA